MSRQINFFAPGEYYHVYNRGTEKRLIFVNDTDRIRFLSLLYLCNNKSPTRRSDYLNKSFEQLLEIPREQTLVDIGAYCLMPNHFHLLLHEHTKDGISILMQKLSTAYTMYFNKRYKRNGSLFQGRFHAEHSSNDNYLKYLFAYIHLNPIGIIDAGWKNHRINNKKKILDYLNSYRFSSYLDYAKKDLRFTEGKILNKSAFPEYFQTTKDFQTEIQDWINFSSNENVKVQP